MSRIISRIVAVGAGNVDGVRVSEPDDMTLPGLLPGPRLFVHRLRTTHGLVATAFEWAQLAVFLATSRVAVIPRLGISLGVAGGLALIRLATAAKWEVVIEAMSTSFIISYLIQLIAAAASANAANVLVDWVGAITQLAVAFMLSLACLAPLHHPFVREKVVEGMWRNGAPYATKRERWDASGPGTPLYKPALSLTILWIVVFLIMGASGCVVAAYYPGDAPMPGWFEGVFAYAIPFGALAIGILATHLAKSKMAAKARQQQPSLEAGKAVELEAPTTYYVAQNGRMEY